MEETVGSTSSGGHKWTVLAVVSVGAFMATLDSSIVNVSLPAIAGEFGVPVGAAVEWVVIAYFVVVAALLLTAGRLADLLGRKIMWVVGLAIFTTASALCGLAPSLGLLVVARALQAIGGALIMAICAALITAAFPPEERGRAIGFNAVFVALGISAGPALGGLITEHASWRWIFYPNVPLGVVGLLATLKFLPNDASQRKGIFDPVGAILLGVALASATAAISLGNDLGWRSPSITVLAAAAVLCTALFAWVEPRHPAPVVDFSLFRSRVFASANLSLSLCFIASFAISFLLPFYCQQLHGFGAAETGLLLTPLPLTIALVAPASGSLADGIGSRWLAAIGMSILFVGLLLLSQIDARSSKGDVIWRLVVAGFGQGIFQAPNNSALIGAAPRDQQGVASGMLATARVIGQSVSVALAGAVFATRGGASAGRGLVQAEPGADVTMLQMIFVTSLRSALLVCAVVAALGIVTSLVRGREERTRAATACRRDHVTN